MKKVFKIENLDCAHCAAKIEDEIKNLDGVENANLSFMTQRLIIKADEEIMDDIIFKAKKICKKIEPDCSMI